jgi:predicted amidohydrolase YtcJ
MMDLALFPSRIVTNNPAQPWAEAIRIKDSRIAEVGSRQAVKKNCSAATCKIELPGRLIIPGIIDGHCHFVKLGLMLQQIDLRGLSSLGACRERIRQAAQHSKPGQWIIGRGWDHHQWAEKREPTRHDLDDLTPGNPTAMVRVCGHSIWANTLALARSTISQSTRNPPGGTIERDPVSGEPTGLIREAIYLISNHFPPLGRKDRKHAALEAQKQALQYGITGVHSCETLLEFEALEELVNADKLKLRVYHLIPSDELEEAVSRKIGSGIDTNRLWSGHVKLFADGSLGSATALLHKPYLDEPQNAGIACLSPEALFQRVTSAYRHGYEVAIHAIGDKAVTNALQAIARARKICPGDRRDRIEHVQLFRPRDLALFRDLGVTASVQPVFFHSDWQVAIKKWGPDRCRFAYAWKSLLNAGIPIQFGSDAPVEPINPLLGFQEAATRHPLDEALSDRWFPSKTLTVDECIRAFTCQPAWTSRKENHLGILTPGRWADLTVYKQDFFNRSPDQWSGVTVDMTIVDGEIVYQP